MTLRVSQQPACILHLRAWRETSLLLECLCRDHGRVGLVARGARSGRGRIPRGTLQPFQDLEIDFSGRGELMTLGAAEPTASPRWLAGDALYAGLYLNELLVRMLARQDDAHPQLLTRYRGVLDDLAGAQDVAWPLRRFERDLLAMLGYALALDRRADNGAALQADADYAWIPEQGAVAWAGQDSVRLQGADLLALAADSRPDAAALGRLRRLMRQLIRWHAPGGDLKSWSLLSSWRPPS